MMKAHIGLAMQPMNRDEPLGPRGARFIFARSLAARRLGAPPEAMTIASEMRTRTLVAGGGSARAVTNMYAR